MRKVGNEEVIKAIPGYTILEKIHVSHPYVIFYARRSEDGLEVLIKTLIDRFPNKEDLLRLRREFRITRKLHLDGAIRFYDLVSHGSGNLAIIMERFGISLAQHLGEYDQRVTPLEKFFPLAMNIVKVCGQVHEKRIVHKKLEPSNILINTNSNEIRFIDFGSSSELSHEHVESVSLTKSIEGSLAYISPEQTGRINRDTDYRSDYYSLGVTFYQMLTGQLPYEAQDPMEWVHCIIGRQVTPVHEVNKNIPEILSNIIGKLMAKNAEMRYQSTKGLLSDLEKCRKVIEEGDEKAVFELGKTDVSRKFQIPQKLYGREEEIQKLESFFEQAARGTVEFCLVSGYSGVGKTSLVRELGSSIVQKNGYLIQGKFEQYKQNTAYAALGNAFRDLMRQILGEPKSRLATWRSKILHALGNNAQVMIDLIPELELIIEEQPPVQEISPVESQNRFLMLFSNFVGVFASEGHPLVIFLDDLQWSDVPSLNLFHRIVTSNELNHLLVIGAYRDNEVDTTHPLSLTLREIQGKRVVENLSLKPLDLEATDELIRDTLLFDASRSRQLSKVLYEKTGGNPFFTIELLKNLHDRQAIYFNERESCWAWDLEAIRSENYSDNVIDVLVESQSRLEPDAQHVLQLAACIGASFDLRTLSIIAESPLEKVASDLQGPLGFNMLVPMNESYKYVGAEGLDLNALGSNGSQDFNPVYNFQHDRVQQAAYSQIPLDQRKALHLSIGRLMLDHSSEEVKEERLMEIVEHLNEGRELIKDHNESHLLARLNLAAGIKAKQSSAYDAALGFLRVGHESVGSKAWEQDYDMTWQLHQELQHTFYLTGDWKMADRLTELLMDNSRTAIEKGLVLAARTRQYATTERMQESIKAAYEGLSILGFEFTSNPTREDILEERMKIDEKLGGRSISSLVELQEIMDQKANIANQLLMEIFPAAFLSGSGEMFPYLVLKSVNLALEYGNSLEASFAYVAYGMLLCGLYDETAKGYEFGKAGVKISEKYEDISLKSRILYVYTMFIHHWSNHWSTMTPWFRRGIDSGYQSGDLLYLAYSAQDCIIWDPRLDLETASKEHRKLLDIVKECDYQDSYDSGTLFLQMQLNFQGLTESKYSMTNEDFDEVLCLEGMNQRHFMTGISNYHIYKAEIHLLYNDPQGALEHVMEQEKRMASVLALPQSARFQIVAFLVRSMLMDSAGSNEQRSYSEKMQGNLNKVSVWADHCKENYEHLRLLMEAELAGKEVSSQAIPLYESAIARAKKEGFLRDEAMSNEMAARYLIRQGMSKAAEGYLREAHYLYYRWGAHRKVEDMEKSYAIFEASGQLKRIKTANSGKERKAMSESSSIDHDTLDMSSVFKASQMISGELDLEKLLKSTLHILIENAGAEKGYIVDSRESRILIRAESRNGKDVIIPHEESQDPENPTLLPLSLINTTLRTNQPVVINNASENNPFSADPYIESRKPLSVICVPLTYHGRWPSAVYLENNLTHSAFTEDRIKVIKLLASQASISMENARIYERQDRLLKAQQRFVPKQFLKHLGHKDITKVELGESVAMEMSVLFTDILDFTPLVEKQSPQVVIEFLNRLFNELGQCIADSEGFIDSYAGDQIMALFAVSPVHAVQAGIDMSRSLDRFNKNSEKQGLPPVRLGIGINTGPLVLGTMGANERMQCSVLGDTVNLASRIEQLNRFYGTNCIIGEHTYNLMENREQFSIRAIDYVAVKGKGEAVRLYEVLDAENDDRRGAKEATRDLLMTGMEAYYSRNFREASNLFGQAIQLDKSDKVLSMFLSRSDRYVKSPPPENWKGFENLEYK